jgi:DNA-binding transcriptional regulator YdaS (Cro superfamily)
MSNFRKHVARAVKLLGSQKKLADAIGCSQQHVSYLLHDADRVSAEVALKIDEATGGQVSRNSLRPDIFGPPSRERGGKAGREIERAAQ